jgi:hypothetical protein
VGDEAFLTGIVVASVSFFNDLPSAQAFFTADVLNLGHFSNGATDVELLFDETMSSNEGFEVRQPREQDRRAAELEGAAF